MQTQIPSTNLSFDSAQPRSPIEDSTCGSSVATGRRSKPPRKPKASRSIIRLTKGDSQDAFEFFQGHKSFQGVPEGGLRSLAKCCRYTTVAPRNYLIAEGEEYPLGFIVVEGRMAMMKTSLSGKDLIVEVLMPGDIFGVLLSLQQSPAQLSAYAQIESKVLEIPHQDLRAVLDAYPEFYKEFSAQLLLCLQSSYRLSRALAYDSVEMRIAAVLSRMAVKCNQTSQTERECVIDMTRRQLADLSGTTPETAIRVTRSLQSKGIIDIKHPGTIKVVDAELLATLAEEY